MGLAIIENSNILLLIWIVSLNISPSQKLKQKILNITYYLTLKVTYNELAMIKLLHVNIFSENNYIVQTKEI